MVTPSSSPDQGCIWNDFRTQTDQPGETSVVDAANSLDPSESEQLPSPASAALNYNGDDPVASAGPTRRLPSIFNSSVMRRRRSPDPPLPELPSRSSLPRIKHHPNRLIPSGWAELEALREAEADRLDPDRRGIRLLGCGPSPLPAHGSDALVNDPPTQDGPSSSSSTTPNPAPGTRKAQPFRWSKRLRPRSVPSATSSQSSQHQQLSSTQPVADPVASQEQQQSSSSSASTSASTFARRPVRLFVVPPTGGAGFIPGGDSEDDATPSPEPPRKDFFARFKRQRRF
ncbi:hypothetical protein A4X13_0g3143 [Tilletia indica]|uniref:Uncharacterized protein n=1 Tax=Tilletia indica TaxID=43049 RepID=A0A177TNG2_9BASI|nr:hypothetical protein A4X13_0g3143 [Tilletia indica]